MKSRQFFDCSSLSQFLNMSLNEEKRGQEVNVFSVHRHNSREGSMLEIASSDDPWLKHGRIWIGFFNALCPSLYLIDCQPYYLHFFTCQFSCHIQGARERGSGWGRLEAEVSDNPAESAESPPGERVRADSDRFFCYDLLQITVPYINYYTITVRPKTLSSANLWKCFSSHKLPKVWERNCFFAHFAQVFRDTWTFCVKVFELDAR